MRRKWIAAIVACVLLQSCGDGPLPIAVMLLTPPVFGPTDSVFADQQLLAAVYSDYGYPPGFYQESRSGPFPYHVNTLSIAPPCCQPPDWRELATDDPQQARAWAESTVAHSTIRAPLDTVPIVTERYIEFMPAANSSARDGVPMRAHRLAYLDRWMFDQMHPDSVRGRLNARPIDEPAIRAVAEYVWYLDWGRTSDKVLSSFTLPAPRGDTHVLYVTRKIRGDWGVDDQVQLRRSAYRVSLTTGDIVVSETLLRTIRGWRR